jgi:hypothetical protein
LEFQWGWVLEMALTAQQRGAANALNVQEVMVRERDKRIAELEAELKASYHSQRMERLKEALLENQASLKRIAELEAQIKTMQQDGSYIANQRAWDRVKELEAQIKDPNNSQRQKRIAELEAQPKQAKFIEQDAIKTYVCVQCKDEPATFGAKCISEGNMELHHQIKNMAQTIAIQDEIRLDLANKCDMQGKHIDTLTAELASKTQPFASESIRANVVPDELRGAITEMLSTRKPNIMHVCAEKAGYVKNDKIAELEAQLAEAKKKRYGSCPLHKDYSLTFCCRLCDAEANALPPHRNVICEDCEKEGDTSIDGHANFYCGSCMAKECMKIEQALPPQSREFLERMKNLHLDEMSAKEILMVMSKIYHETHQQAQSEDCPRCGKKLELLRSCQNEHCLFGSKLVHNIEAQPSPPAAWSEEQIHFVATFQLRQGMAKYITMGEHNAHSLLSALSRPETGGQPEQSEEFLKYVNEKPQEDGWDKIKRKYLTTHQKPRPAEGEKHD